LALTLAKIPFTDERVKFEDWKTLKPKTPQGKLPLLTTTDKDGNNEVVKTQSGAMLRYVGKLAPSLYPADKLYEIEEVIGVLQDMQNSWSPYIYMSMNPSKYGYDANSFQSEEGKTKLAQLRKDWIAKELPHWLSLLEKLMEQNGGGPFLCGGTTPTIADCMAVPQLRAFTKGHIDHVDVQCIAEHSPKLAKYVQHFCALPAIQGRYTTGLGSA
jgi:glutathione S-transferase